MNTCRRPGAQTLLRHKWRKRIQLRFTSLYSLIKLHILLEGVSFIYGSSFRFTVLFFRIAELRQRFAIGFRNWFQHECINFRVFCWNMPRFVDLRSAWTEICKICSNVLLFWRNQNFSKVCFRGFLVCSLNVPLFFSQKVFEYQFTSFGNTMQLYFLRGGFFFSSLAYN